MRSRYVIAGVLTCSALTSAAYAAKPPKDNVYRAAMVKSAITVDGKLDESDWNRVAWEPVKYLWDGKPASSDKDLSGRFKVLWNRDTSQLYVAFESTDDKYSDLTKDPLVDWWTDDAVEVFVDPDNSGGIHQYNHSAFAYHVNMAGDAVDYDEDQTPFNAKGLDHVNAVSKLDSTRPGVRIWEMAITLYSSFSTTDPSINRKQPVRTGDNVGFSIAYCDNDGRKGVRDTFVGWVELPKARLNDSWIDASCFGRVILDN